MIEPSRETDRWFTFGQFTKGIYCRGYVYVKTESAALARALAREAVEESVVSIATAAKLPDSKGLHAVCLYVPGNGHTDGVEAWFREVIGTLIDENSVNDRLAEPKWVGYRSTRNSKQAKGKVPEVVYKNRRSRRET
jgi:hypothetical protein